jgi:separase
MGCSSGQAEGIGEYEGEGMVHAYLLAGSPTVVRCSFLAHMLLSKRHLMVILFIRLQVANLWDVSDKDIDRFSLAVIDAWFLQKTDRSLGDIIPAARAACKLQNLVGHSPVCFGVPVYNTGFD